MHCLRVGMRIPIHSSRADLMMPIPWEVVGIPIYFLRVRMDIPWLVGGDGDLLSFCGGIDENPLETLQDRSGNANALLNPMLSLRW